MTGDTAAAAPVSTGPRAPVLSVDDVLDDLVVIDGPQVVDDTVFWAEVRFDHGRCALWRRDPGGPAVRVTGPEVDVRSEVYEYGGGAWAVAPGLVAYCDRAAGEVVLEGAHGTRVLARTTPGLRYGDLSLAPGAGRLLAVRERHVPDGGEPVHDVVAIALDGSGDVVVVASGADFVASPRWCPDGRVAWVEWDHPHMPWQSSRVVVAALRPGEPVGPTGHHVVGSTGHHVVVAGGPGESALHPLWAQDEDGDWSLLLCSDRSGHWELVRWTASAQGPTGTLREVAPAGADVARAPWGLGHQPFAPLPGGRVLGFWFDDGATVLGTSDDAGHRTRLPTAACSVLRVAAHDRRAAALVGYPDRPAAVITWDHRLAGSEVDGSEVGAGEIGGGAADGGAHLDAEVVRAAGSITAAGGAAASASRPRSVRWPGPAGTVHGWYHPPSGSGRAGREAAPPLLVVGHGGPTSVCDPSFSPDRRLWTDRGFAVLDVNYSGSAGFGRAYRERLDGRWGELDVADCVAGARTMVEQGLADPSAVVVRGASAGGYTVLQALATSSVFTAGVSLYGIGDLRAMARDTHKLESHYLDTLVGDPADEERYLERSPLRNAARMTAPVLLLQGTEDAVVPPAQARSMADALRAAGVEVELVELAGEGHGFRTREALRRSFEAELTFLSRVLGTGVTA